MKNEANSHEKIASLVQPYGKIVKLHGALRLESPMCHAVALVMNFYEHGSYALEIRRRSYHNMRFEETEILTIFIRIFQIVWKCDYHRIWHRDIKPDNILVN